MFGMSTRRMLIITLFVLALGVMVSPIAYGATDDDGISDIGYEAVEDYSNWDLYSNLEYAIDDARAFNNGMTEEGIESLFSYEENLAWDSDFEEYSDGFVDTVDMVYFAGHGNVERIIFNNKDYDNGKATISEMGSDGEKLGTYDLEWIVFMSCRTLAVETDYGSFFPFFEGGLHMALGWEDSCPSAIYGGALAENITDGGNKIKESYIEVTKVLGGEALPWWVSSQTAKIISANGDEDDDFPSEDDHFWGYGPVGEDPTGNLTLLIDTWEVEPR